MTETDLTIVYKTYRNDLRWLKYSLTSLKKFFKHPHKLLIYCHDECIPELIATLTEVDVDATMIPVEYDIHGYLKQQVVKIMCWQDVDTEYIAVMDSDIVLTSPIDFSYFINGNKIKWHYLPRNDEHRSSIHWPVWQEAVARMTGEPMMCYYMQDAFPFMFKAQTLKNAFDKFIEKHGVDYNEFCKNGLNQLGISISDPIAGPNGRFDLLAKVFTEFEYLGWYCRNFSNDYEFIEGSNHDAKNMRIQYWSHGGVGSFEEQIKSILDGQES